MYLIYQRQRFLKFGSVDKWALTYQYQNIKSIETAITKDASVLLENVNTWFLKMITKKVVPFTFIH